MKYKFILSNDGSPTIDYFQNSTQSETMHNRVGAFTETLYIYHHALKTLNEKQWPNKVLSVGLGLGYNELLTVAQAIKSSSLSSTYMESFEVEEDLRVAFVHWLSGHESAEEVEFYKSYDLITQLLEKELQVPALEIKESLHQLKESGQWVLRNELNGDCQFSEKFHCILYDAYSSHTSPELWQEDFLQQLLAKAAHQNCILSTYAAKGTLSRALKAAQFEVVKREGFGGKRQSTFAVRD